MGIKYDSSSYCIGMHELVKASTHFISLPRNLAQPIRKCLATLSTNISVSYNSCPANSFLLPNFLGEWQLPTYLAQHYMCIHTYTGRHVTYQFMLRFSSNTKTEAEGNRKGYRVLLTTTCFGGTYRAHMVASGSHFARCCTNTYRTYLSQLYISSPFWRPQSLRIWAIPAKVTWKKSAGIIKRKLSKKCLRFTNRSLQHREVKGPTPRHAKSCFQRSLNINLPSPPWRLKCDLFALRQEHTLLCLLLSFVCLFSLFLERASPFSEIRYFYYGKK